MHLSEFDITCLIDRKVKPARRREIISHLAECEECEEALGSALRLMESLQRSATPEVNSSLANKAEDLRAIKAYKENRGIARGIFLRYAVAAVILVGVGISGYLLLRQQEPSRLRGSSNGRSIETMNPVDGAPVPTMSPEFRWAEVPGVSLYRLFLFNEDATITWKWDSKATQFIPETVLQLQPGQRYFWRVEALFLDGTRTQSEVHVFTYSP